MKHFAIIDTYEGNRNVIGIIQNVPKTDVGIQSFKERLTRALEDFFDTDECNIQDIAIDDIFENYGKPFETSVEIDGNSYPIEIQETFFY
jgi:hypothetical protein